MNEVENVEHRVVNPDEAKTEDEFKGALALAAERVSNGMRYSEQFADIIQWHADNTAPDDLRAKIAAFDEKVAQDEKKYCSAVLGRDAPQNDLETRADRVKSAWITWEHDVGERAIYQGAEAIQFRERNFGGAEPLV